MARRILGDTGLKQDRPAAVPLTPRRRVVRETSMAGGLRVLYLECGHTCVTRDHTVVLETPCLLCVTEEQ